MTGSTYAPALRVLHWSIAILIFCIWPLGYMIKFVRDEVKLDFYLLHESLGFLALWIMILRIGLRLRHGAPAPIVTGFHGRLAGLVHTLLYAFLIIMPVSGFLATNAHGFPLKWFGLVEVWSPLNKSPGVAPIFSRIHEWSAWTLLALLALHLTGVIFHHVIRRDRTLYRML
ncbi:cytochrome b/b6 domain-containing protein [Rhizobium sp. SSA_523]|uniref:cytochrome b n=1 Tax=Rhizobium sp. SSA_523 TaxID=2952477 RepID=UPI002090B195|nr:cytochrome b/b6 domain-containing protein [Rhizobium sp. SSA_523]MCO5732487.1 cytochrome b/b6 domain-containing protein [Rhizobium sp. SSA_523]WKC22372.1 cytochrome b/b6 domain-containing protein [Rhizobium sp. SSA_523]